MVKAYLALGSNLGDRLNNLEKSLSFLCQQVEILKKSNIYQTKPYGGVMQNDFLNAEIQIKTNQSLRELLNFVKEVEMKMGRKQTIRWGARIIDIDILLYKAETFKFCESDLQIPHVELTKRSFVLVPLRDIYDKDTLFGKKFAQLIQETGNIQDVQKFTESWHDRR